MNKQRVQVVASDEEAQRVLGRRSRRDFLIGGVAAVAAIGGYEWLKKAPQEDGAPWPERRVLEFNRKLSEGYLSHDHLMPTYPRDRVAHLKANGDIGMDPSFNLRDWSLQVDTTPATHAPMLNLSLADIKALPKQEMITQFCCIEGWSTVVYWGGARFSDFTKKFFPPGAQLPKYVYMATPDEDYYVGLDMKSALHPQTLLAYERNGQPLEPEHGAPLRLAIPVKYGIKNIKRLALIRYTNEKPGDYWAEEGYDWFAGL